MWQRLMTRAAALVLAGGATAVTAVSATGADHESVAGPSNGLIYFSTGLLVPNPDFGGTTPQVYSMRPDGTGLRRLTNVPRGSAAGAPSVSPDGGTVAYVATDDTGGFAVWLMDSDGTDQRELLATTGTDYFTPSWSPDGSRLLVTSCLRLPGAPDCPLVTVGADGTGLTTLLSNQRVNYAATYSPDGRRIQFSSDQRGLLGAIWVARADGSHQRRLTDPDLEASFGAWSPDGEHIAFGDNCCRPHSNVWSVDVRSGELKQLTHVGFGHGDASFPAYSPDGQSIVFATSVSDPGGFDLWTMRSDGSDEHLVQTKRPFSVQSSWGAVPGSAPLVARTRDPRPAVGPALGPNAAEPVTTTTTAPDGRIAVIDTNSAVVDTVNPDGTALVQVTTPAQGAALQATWTPDGSHLVVLAIGDDGLGLYEVAADGSDWHLLMLDRPGFVDLFPKVSPDGQSVFFARCRPDPPGRCAIAAANIDGTGRHLVTDYTPPRVDATQVFFAISPDGTRLAYGEQGLGGIADQVWIVDVDGHHAHPVSGPALEAVPSDWAADGQSVLVTSAWRHVGEEIFTVPVEGGTPARVLGSTYPLSVYLPDQSPSGSSLTYLSEVVPRFQAALYVAASDGSAQHQIDIDGSPNDPQWGTAPLLPPSAATPAAQRAPALPARDLRELRSALPKGLADLLLPPG